MAAVETTQILEPFGPATALVLTDEQVDELGGGKRAAVTVTIGDVSQPLRLAVMGGRNVIGLSKQARAALGVDLGDEVTARIELDEAPREVALPDELDAAFVADPEARRLYDALAYTHRKTFAQWVGEAKQVATRIRRATQAVEMLHDGRTR